ncbi:ATP-binding protein [Amycolatopsis sp. NPDC059027]|uniref:ATP-binding protein n=1 Tax=unclassified Amycolatopsis TaxID=2618356 RepID=UPI0036701C1E
MLRAVDVPRIADSLLVEVTTYVGRQAELAEAARLIETASLVTLTGPGGVGKTRLAQRVAEGARGSFRDGVVFVGLAELGEPQLLVNMVADRLGLGDRSSGPPIDLVVDQLRDRRLLLVLDNCEHLVEACGRLADTLVRSCPDVVVLATSRQSLGVEGERVLPVPPLAVPPAGEPAESARYDALQLFVDRATAVVPSFAVTPDNAEDLARLCRALDGLPLAIELAAVRLRSLSVRQLAERLDHRFTLLTRGYKGGPSRHETLRALIDWSHELCTERERQFWSRASVFSGSFDLDAAEEVCSGDGLDRAAVLDVIDGLIDKSLLLREEEQGVARYRMLQTVRQYGEDRLRADDDLTRWRRRHRDWCRELTRGFEAGWFGSEQGAWIAKLREEHANLRAALDFCASDAEEAVVGLRMVYAVKEYWVRSLNTEGRMWLSKLLEAATPDAPGRAAALWMYAFLALVQADRDAFESALAKAAEIAERTADAKALAFVDHVRAYSLLIDNRSECAASLFGAAAERFRELGDEAAELWSTYNYGLAVSLTGDRDQGRRVLQECIERYAARGEISWRCWALWSLSAAEYLHGDMEAATVAGLELLRLQPGGDRTIVAFALTVMAGCATHTGQPRRAARMFGAAAEIWRSVGASLNTYAAFEEPMQRDIQLVTGELGLEEAAQEFLRGTALTMDEAVAYVLDTGSPDDDPRPADNADVVLTKREAQVAELVAEGMTNREIAEKLVIARRTAETHVDHILTKLGFSSRAQIAVWVVSRRS